MLSAGLYFRGICLIVSWLLAGEQAFDIANIQPFSERYEPRFAGERIHEPEIVPGIYMEDGAHYRFSNAIALTIDDCAPDADLASTLDTLKSRGIRAVFFIIGQNFVDAHNNPRPRATELLHRIVAEGHAIGSHTFKHDDFDKLPLASDRALIKADMAKVQSAVDACLGYHYPLVYFRPPYGNHFNPRHNLDQVLKDAHMLLINWTCEGEDWRMNSPTTSRAHRTASQVLNLATSQARDSHGGVLLYHSFHRSAELLDQLLGSLVASPEGFRFVNLETILEMKYHTAQAVK